jgi:hypothetical protein
MNQRWAPRHTPDLAMLCLAAVLGVAPGALSGCKPGVTPQAQRTGASEYLKILQSGATHDEKLRAIEGLKAMGPSVVPEIADALSALPPEIDGSWLGQALFAFGEDAAPAGEAVLSRLVLGTTTAHMMASVLEVSGPRGQELLVRALEPHHPEECLVAALIKVEPDTDSAVLAIGRLVDHESADVREEALSLLWESAEKGRSQLNAIRNAFRDSSDVVRVAAVEAAASVAARGDATTGNALGELLMREDESRVVSAAIDALLALEVRTETVRQGLERVAASGGGETSAEAEVAVRKLFSD